MSLPIKKFSFWNDTALFFFTTFYAMMIPCQGTTGKKWKLLFIMLITKNVKQNTCVLIRRVDKKYFYLNSVASLKPHFLCCCSRQSQYLKGWTFGVEFFEWHMFFLYFVRFQILNGKVETGETFQAFTKFKLPAYIFRNLKPFYF
jgi:hypothetical protein